MEIIDRGREQSFRVSRPKPVGGYCIVNSYTLLSAWVACRQKIIELVGPASMVRLFRAAGEALRHAEGAGTTIPSR